MWNSQGIDIEEVSKKIKLILNLMSNQDIHDQRKYVGMQLSRLSEQESVGRLVLIKLSKSPLKFLSLSECKSLEDSLNKLFSAYTNVLTLNAEIEAAGVSVPGHFTEGVSKACTDIAEGVYALVDSVKHSFHLISLMASEIGDSLGEASQIEKIAQHCEQRKKEIDEAVKAASRAAGAAGVGAFDDSFSKFAEDQASEALLWTVAVAALVVCVLVLGVSSENIFVLKDKDWPSVVQTISSKIVSLGVLVWLLIFCARMVRSARHQSAVNFHRANSLKSFQAFVVAADSDELKDAILAEAAKCIFSPVGTGYLDNETSASYGSLPIVADFAKTVSSVVPKSG